MQINLKRLGYIFLIMPFIIPAYFYNFKTVATIIKLFKCIIFFIFLIMILTWKNRISKPGKYILMYQSFVFLIGIYNKYFSFDIIVSIFLCILFEYGLSKKDNYFLEGLYKILEFLIYINLISVLVFPNGMYNNGVYDANWLLGYKNPMIRLFIPVCAIGLLISYKKYNKFNIRSKLLIIISIITVILVDSSTGIVGMLVFISMLLATRSKFWREKITLFRGFIVYIISNFFVITGTAERYISFFIEGILNRSMTFTGRTTIWEKTLELIREHLFIGIGDCPSEMMEAIIVGPHPHNYFLYILLQSGIIGIIILLLGIKSADKCVKISNDKKACNIMVAALLSFYIMGITESITAAILMYPLYIIIGNMDKINYSNNEVKN